MRLGTKYSDEQRKRLSDACKASPNHRSKHQGGEKNTAFKRGNHIDKHGYTVVTINGKQHMQHRLVMEKMIGRKLHEKETVHHKNGQRSDNRPSNLELWSSRNPKGQRIEDKIEWATEFLNEYGFVVVPIQFFAKAPIVPKQKCEGELSC